MTSSTRATSATLRAIGLSDPEICGQPSYTPVRLTSPSVGLIPTTDVHPDGRRIEASASCPIATPVRLAATLAPDPPDEPPTVRSSAYGFRVDPNSDP